MKTLLAVLSLIFLIGIGNCNRQVNPASSILGYYELVGRDHSGQRAFTGTISLTSIEEQHINGQCEIVREKDADPGVLDQTPRCQAFLEGKKITIDFAPFLDDGGLIFEGEIGDDRISGLWMFKSIAGTQPQGKFDAVKK